MALFRLSYLMNEGGETRVNKKKVIGRDEGLFVKTMFEFKESRANVPQVKRAHEEYHISKVNVLFVHLLTSLMVGAFFIYKINFRSTGSMTVRHMVKHQEYLCSLSL